MTDCRWWLSLNATMTGKTRVAYVALVFANDGEYDYATFKNVPSAEFELTYAISGEKASITFVKVPQEFNDLLNTTITDLHVESVKEEDYTIE